MERNYRKIAAALLACLISSSSQSAWFAYNQEFKCAPPDYGWSFTMVYNYNTGGSWYSSDYYHDYYYVDYDLPYDAWVGLFIYDYTKGKYDEAVWLTDSNW